MDILRELKKTNPSTNEMVNIIDVLTDHERLFLVGTDPDRVTPFDPKEPNIRSATQLLWKMEEAQKKDVSAQSALLALLFQADLLRGFDIDSALLSSHQWDIAAMRPWLQDFFAVRIANVLVKR